MSRSQRAVSGPGSSRGASGELPLPLAVRRGGRQGWATAVAAGGVLGAITLMVPALLSRQAGFGFLAILLGAIAAVYLGFALQDGRRSAFRTEYIGMALFLTLATAALARDSAWLLAAGYLGHGLWDAIHHRRAIDTAMPWWYVPLCLGYDSVVAAYILLRYL